MRGEQIMLKLKNIVAALAFAAMTQVAGSAVASPADDTLGASPRVVVSYSDLDLGTDAGAKALRSRLDAAIDRVEGSADLRDLDAQAARQKAHAKAMQMADAVIAAHRTNLAFAGQVQLNVD
jgi:UrcA family protein